jgi:hypothetical protein
MYRLSLLNLVKKVVSRGIERYEAIPAASSGWDCPLKKRMSLGLSVCIQSFHEESWLKVNMLDQKFIQIMFNHLP